MNTTAMKALQSYTRIGVETGVAAADPHKLILLLFEGAMLAITDARTHMTARRIAPKGRALTKAIAIIDGGLKASLEMKAGGELAERLAGLYDYMCNRIVQANAQNDPAILDEVSKLLSELATAWASIGRHAARAPRRD